MSTPMRPIVSSNGYHAIKTVVQPRLLRIITTVSSPGKSAVVGSVYAPTATYDDVLAEHIIHATQWLAKEV